MSKSTEPAVLWKSEPDDHDYPAAEAYLSLIANPAVVGTTVASLTASQLTHAKAKDILRASRLELLPADDQYVARDLAKIKAGHALSPVLLVRGSLLLNFPLEIADGYHRVCASYHVNDNVDVPCHIAEFTRGPQPSAT